MPENDEGKDDGNEYGMSNEEILKIHHAIHTPNQSDVEINGSKYDIAVGKGKSKKKKKIIYLF